MNNKEELLKKTKTHPCYNKEAHHKYARIHLPIAPKCNIKCGYCNRKYDCVNESRPGVTSNILTPETALDRYCLAKQKIDHLSVVGIAGPGDPLANWETVKETLYAIRAIDSEVIFCLSTNGLMIEEYAEEMIKLGIKHVTVTVNSIDPEIGSQVYKYINYNGKKYEGIEGASILIKKQLKGIEILAKEGVLVKVNTVMIKGVNDFHIPKIVKEVKELGAFIGNIIPLIPTERTDFENFPAIDLVELNKLRIKCEIDLKQMKHCKQCRADAVGKLGEDCSMKFMIS